MNLNFCVKICSFLVLIIAFIFNSIGNFMGFGDIISTTSDITEITTEAIETTIGITEETHTMFDHVSSSLFMTYPYSSSSETSTLINPITYDLSSVYTYDNGIVYSVCCDQKNQFITANYFVKPKNSSVLKENSDGLIIDANGTVLLEKIIPVSDGGFLAVGNAEASVINGESIALKGHKDGLIIRFSEDLEIEWVKLIGGTSDDEICSVYVLPDGSFILGGNSSSNDGDMENLGTEKIKAFVFKYSSDGEIVWKQALSGSKHNSVKDIAVNKSGEINVVISCLSCDGEFSDLEGTENGKETSVIVKLNKNGDILWKKALYDSGRTIISSIVSTPDGGCVVAGSYSLSSKGAIGSLSGLYSGGLPGTTDGVVIRFNSDGSIVWKKGFVGFENDFITDIVKTQNGYAVLGKTNSSNRDFEGVARGGNDIYVYFLGENGSKDSAWFLQGSGDENSLDMFINNEGTIYICGTTYSNDGDFGDETVLKTSDKLKSFIAKFEMK